MAREQIPITADVLQWARERAGFSIDDLRRDFRQLEAWERGESFPTYPQLEKLADRFKVPVAVFFFPEPPYVAPAHESFRTLSVDRFDALPHRVRFLLRKATALRINLEELNGGQNPAERFILRDVRLTPEMDIPAMAAQVRAYLGVTLERQRSWTNSEAAFEAWRGVLADHGVAVFKDAFGDEDTSGFCLYHEVFPLVYVNNSSVKTRQSFTLFHELAHLLFHTSGIDTLSGDPGEGLTPAARHVEAMCNRFAAEFLLPTAQFETDMRGLPPTMGTATQLAKHYHVSRELVFRRFLDRGDITQEDYRRAAAQWAEQRQEGSGGNHYWTKIVYLGINYINLAFSRYAQNRISETELADYLDTKVRSLPKLESYLSRKVS